MKVLRTPDDRFDAIDLPAPRYVEVPSGEGEPLRMAYLDVGPRDAPVVLMLHGEPTWSFLYRAVIARVVDAGLRAIAPDLVGFGRSDKPADTRDYTYDRHVAWLVAFLDAADLRGVHLVCQDWGGLLGLRIVADQPERFASVTAMNTTLPTAAKPAPPEFHAWRERALTMPTFPVGALVASLCATPLPDAAIAAYDAPFPDESYKAGARIFPALLPIRPDEPAALANAAAWEKLARFERPFLTIFGDGDPMTRGAERVFQKRIPGSAGQPHAVLPGVAHFIQEDAGDEVGRRIAAFVNQQSGRPAA